MKRMLLFLVPILLLASCQQYDNSIHGRGLSDSSFYEPVDSAYLAYVVATGFVHIDSSHAGNPLISDSVYTVSPTWSQAWKWAGQRNNRIWFWIGFICLIAPLAIFVYLGNKGGYGMEILILPAFAIFVGVGLMGGSIEWERWNMDQTIDKMIYSDFMRDPGNLGPFWDTIRIK
jgi:hypothetical protein